MRVADAVAQWLVDRGFEVGFGIIGGGNVVLWDSIATLGRTKLVCCHHEQAAVMASAYYARSKRRAGFALVTTGAGSANAITGVLAGHMDGVPILVISGNEASKHMNAPTRVWGVQGYDSSGLARSFTKAASRLSDPMALEHDLGILHGAAMRCPQGPVWLDIPKDMQGAPA